MTCRDFENLMVVSVWGELTHDQKKNIQAHIKDCVDCAEKYDKLAHVKFTPPETELIAKPDWNKSWYKIRNEVVHEHPRLIPTPQHRRLALAFTFVLVFAIGIFTGRRYLFDKQIQPILFSSLRNEEHFIDSYTETLELVSIQLMNRNLFHKDDEIQIMEKQILTEMRIQTQILKQMMIQKNQIDLANLFEDIDMLLIGISNLDPENQEAAKQLHELIQEKSSRLQVPLIDMQNSI